MKHLNRSGQVNLAVYDYVGNVNALRPVFTRNGLRKRPQSKLPNGLFCSFSRTSSKYICIVRTSPENLAPPRSDAVAPVKSIVPSPFSTIDGKTACTARNAP